MKKQKLEILDRPPRKDMEHFEAFAFGAFSGAVGLYLYCSLFGV